MQIVYEPMEYWMPQSLQSGIQGLGSVFNSVLQGAVNPYWTDQWRQMANDPRNYISESGFSGGAQGERAIAGKDFWANPAKPGDWIFTPSGSTPTDSRYTQQFDPRKGLFGLWAQQAATPGTEQYIGPQQMQQYQQQFAGMGMAPRGIRSPIPPTNTDIFAAKGPSMPQAIPATLSDPAREMIAMMLGLGQPPKVNLQGYQEGGTIQETQETEFLRRILGIGSNEPDRVPMLAEPGEKVIPTAATAALDAILQKNGYPGGTDQFIQSIPKMQDGGDPYKKYRMMQGGTPLASPPPKATTPPKEPKVTPSRTQGINLKLKFNDPAIYSLLQGENVPDTAGLPFQEDKTHFAMKDRAQAAKIKQLVATIQTQHPNITDNDYAELRKVNDLADRYLQSYPEGSSTVPTWQFSMMKPVLETPPQPETEPPAKGVTPSKTPPVEGTPVGLTGVTKKTPGTPAKAGFTWSSNPMDIDTASISGAAGDPGKIMQTFINEAWRWGAPAQQSFTPTGEIDKQQPTIQQQKLGLAGNLMNMYGGAQKVDPEMFEIQKQKDIATVKMLTSQAAAMMSQAKAGGLTPLQMVQLQESLMNIQSKKQEMFNKDIDNDRQAYMVARAALKDKRDDKALQKTVAHTWLRTMLNQMPMYRAMSYEDFIKAMDLNPQAWFANEKPAFSKDDFTAITTALNIRDLAYGIPTMGGSSTGASAQTPTEAPKAVDFRYQKK